MEKADQTQPVAPIATPNTKSKSSKNVPAIALGITTALGLGAAAFFGVQYFNQKNLSAQCSSSTPTCQTPATTESTESNSDTSTPTATNITLGFDGTKVVNGNSKYTLRDSSFRGITLSLKDSASYSSPTEYINTVESQKSAQILLVGSIINQFYGTSLPDSFSATINFDKKVTDMAVAGFGQSAGNEVLIFVLEDGSVAYIPVKQMLQQERYEVFGILPNLPAMSRTFSVDAIDYVTTLIQAQNGDLYDLQPIFRDLGIFG